MAEANMDPNLANLKSAVIGTWRLVSAERHASDGSVARLLGDEPAGYIVYTEDNHVFVQLMQRGPRRFSGGAIFGGTSDECWKALGYAAYGGTYEFRDGMVVHQVELSPFPGLTGNELLRHMDWDGVRLVLTTLPRVVNGLPQFSRLTWERVRAH
jgi:hypothetical protein